MTCRNRCAKVNVKVLVILLVVAVALGTSLFAARGVQREMHSKAALAAGETAFENQDWSPAAKNFRAYLNRNPDDLEILRKYAQACLAIRPLDAKAISGAIAAYRHVVQMDPQDEVAYEKLAMLYGGISNFEELAATARLRLEHVPNDRKARLWLADALIRLNKRPEAEQILLKLVGEIEALPEAHTEYVRACEKMSEAVLADGGAEAKAKALEWLNTAVSHAPESVEALLVRAKFYRETPEIPDVEEKDRLGLARQGLEEADNHGTDNPQLRLFLAAEWMAYGAYDRTAAELEACEKFPPEALQNQFLDLNSWTIAKYLLRTEVAMRRGTPGEAAALADQTLASFTEPRYRIQVLPPAILAYVGTGKGAQARQYLDEYLGIVGAQSKMPGLAEKITKLRAYVASVENKPYAVIDTLVPMSRSDASDPDLWRMLAEAYIRTDQAGRAVSALTQCNQLRPGNPQVMLELARQYSKLGEWKKAFDAAAAVEARDPANVAAKLVRIGAGMNLAIGQQGTADLAELKKLSAELADLRQAQPGQVDIRVLQAIIAGYLESLQETERLLKLAIAECPEPLRAEMQLSGHYLKTGRIPEAIAVCEAACQRHPNLAEPWLALADVHAAHTDYDSARNCLKQGLSALTEKGEKRSLSIRLAFLEVVHGDRTTGIDLLKEMAAQDPQEIQARLLLLGVRDIREDPVTTEKLIGELKQAEGENGLWWRLHQASLWLSSGDWRKKQADIESLLGSCIDANPAWSAPVLLKADLYERVGEVKRVEDTLQQALAANPSAADVASRLLTFLEKQNRFSDAERVLQRIQVDPRVLSTWQVRVALGEGNVARATDELKLRVSNDPKDAASRIELARLVYQQTKDAGSALKYLQEAEAITPEAQALIVVKVSILKAEGKSEDALKVLDDYVASHNDFAAYWMRAVYLAERKDLERAEKDYRKLTTFAQNSEAGYQLLGSFYAETKRLDQGIAALEEGLTGRPGSLGLKRDLMRLLLRRAQAQDRERATEILTELEKQLPPDAELLMVRAMLLSEQSTPQALTDARAKLEDAVKLRPTAVNAQYALIQIALRQEDYKAAGDYAVRALESNPKNLTLLLARSRAELALGYVPMAARLAHEALQQDPNNREAVALLTEGALKSHDPALLQEARTRIDSFLGREPKNEGLLVSRAHILIALGPPQAAIPELEAYCQTPEGSQSITTFVTMADLYLRAGDADKSKQKIDQAQKIAPNSQTVIHARLGWLVSQSRWEELKGISSVYLAAKEQDPALLVEAGSALVTSPSADLKKEGVRLLEQAATLAPASAEARLNWASALYQTGEPDRAEKTYREWLAQHPNDGRALNDLAWILQEYYHRYDAALELANKGLRFAPDDMNLLDTRGTILTNLPDRLADARSDFAKLAELLPAKTPGKAKTLLRLGRLCSQLNDLPQAKQHLQTALDIDRELHVFTTVERSEISQIMQQSGT